MSDPFGTLMAGAINAEVEAQAAAAGLPPVPAPTADVVDQVADQVKDAAGTGGPVRRWLGMMWGRLSKPTTHKPVEYADRKLTEIVNEELDRGTAGPAHEARMGEAVSLVVEHLIAAEGGGAETPLGILTETTMAYGYKRWDHTRHGDEPEDPPAPLPMPPPPPAAPPAAMPHPTPAPAPVREVAVAAAPAKRRRGKA